MRFRSLPSVFLLLLAVCAPAARAQEAGVQDGSPIAGQLRVFLDCRGCDGDYIRTELNWVEYMRDRADAQVHVLVSRQGTGGGGTRWTLEFIGLRQFDGAADTLIYTSTSEDSDDVLRQGLTRSLALGFVPFAARTASLERIRVPAPPSQGTDRSAPAQVDDPWKGWSFRVGASGFGSGESQQLRTNVNTNVSASKTTEDWKVTLSGSGRYRENRFEYEDDGELVKTVSIDRNYSAGGLLARSLGPQLSAGFRASINTATYSNTEVGLSAGPIIEYNFVPYSESTRRALLVRYAVGLRHADYREITIFDRMWETHPTHRFTIEYGTNQPWGQVDLSFDTEQYLHDTSKYNAGVGGSVDLRLFKGFSLELRGDYTRVRDQLSLAARDLDQEDVLLQQRELATNYSYFFSVGVNYRFGSIFNSIVNPRLAVGSSD